MAPTQITPELALAALSPMTAFRSQTICTEKKSNHASQIMIPWNDSSLNPKNRVGTLSPSHYPTWRVDGCTSLGTQFYATPIFFSPVQPLHIHTFIPQPSQWPRDLRSVLGIDSAFLYRDSRINNFGIAQHVLRALDNWSSTFTDFHSMYEALPFGSRIVFENMEKDVKEIRIQIVRTHDLERQLMSVASLSCRLAQSPSAILPPILDISHLHLIRHVHDSTAIVELRNSQTRRPDDIVIFKTLSDSPSYLYHELSILLTLPPHPNIMPRPLHLITKKVRFGSKIAIIGFTLPFLPKGSLRDILPRRRIQGSLNRCDQIKWALQITQGMKHIQEKGPGWYCDLRLDNVLLSASDDVVLIDFEQRGVTPSFAAPEIRYLDYVLTLAKETSLDCGVKAEYTMLYELHVGHFREAKMTDEYHGSEPWLCQVKSKREALQLYMLGRVLWCIFEGVSAPQVEIWMDYLHEPEVEFPVFKRTPGELRGMIERCTQGWTQNINVVKRRGKWLVGIPGDEERDSHAALDGFEKVWTDELERAKEFLVQRAKRQLSNGTHFEGRGKPSLREVLETLTKFRDQL